MPMATYKVVMQGRALEVNADSERQAKREAVRYCVYTGGGGGDELDYERFEHDLWLSITEGLEKRRVDHQ